MFNFYEIVVRMHVSWRVMLTISRMLPYCNIERELAASLMRGVEVEKRKDLVQTFDAHLLTFLFERRDW